jgi:hypothetical protein
MAFGDPFGTPFGGEGALARALRYKIPAAATPEGQERIRAYYEALGRFAAMYAEVEAAVQNSLWFYAKTPADIARSIFSGTRVGTGASFILRIFEATGQPDGLRVELADAFTQLRKITTARDLIFHYGAQSIAEGNGVVTNERLAHVPANVQTFPISPEILDEMTADLRKIATLLLSRHAGRPPIRGALNQVHVDSILHAPWQYKPPQSPGAATRKPARLDGSNRKGR